MKKIILLYLLFLSISVFGQTISVSSFKLLDTDLTANTAGTMEIDQNGETAALIKVVTTQTGFTFDGGAMGIVKTLQKPSEIWVYVPRGLKKISISHPQLGMLRDYYLNIPIESARTYELTLVTGEVQTTIKESARSQYLVFKVTPPNAVIELENELLPTTDGVAQKFVKFGTYNYRIQAQNYHTAAGKVTIDNPKEKKVLNINLEPAFGWLVINSDPDIDKAQVFIDNSLVGTIPFKSDNLSSGKHNVKIAKPLYRVYEEIVSIEDNKTTTLNPTLVADYVNVTFTVENDANIYVNNEYKSYGRWSGKLGTGSYIIEAKKNNHRSTTKYVDIDSSQESLSLQLESPAPIYGELNITSTPTFSQVLIDDKDYGQTPLFVPEILIGKHEIELRHDGYGNYTETILIKEGETTNVDGTLKSFVPVHLSSNYVHGKVYIDGTYLGKIDDVKELKAGKHRIRIEGNSDSYNDYEGEFEVTNTNRSFNFLLTPIQKYEVSIVSNGDGRITIDGLSKGKVTKNYAFKTMLSNGKHKISIRNDYSNYYEGEVEVKGKDLKIFVYLKSHKAEIKKIKL